MSNVIWKFKHDRGTETAPLTVSITVAAGHGVIGQNGIAPASGFPDAAIDSAGNLKAFDGTTYSDFISGAARSGIDPDPDTYRLTVRKGGLPISSITFQPVLSSPTATELDINALLLIGKATSATPQQLADLISATADAQGVKTEWTGTLKPQMQQSLADSVLSEVQRNATVVQAVSDVSAAGAQALSMANRVQYPTDTERLAASPANGTNAYVISTRQLWTRTAGAWVSQGLGLLASTDAPFQVIDQAALVAYPGSATALSVGSGPAAGLWFRDDTQTANGVTILSGVSPRKWVRADKRLKADFVLNARTIALADSKTAAMYANLTDPAGTPITAQHAEWSTLLTAWKTGQLDLGNRGSVVLKANLSLTGVTDGVVNGAGTTIYNSAAKTNLLTFFTPVRLAFNDLRGIGTGTEWDNTKQGYARFLSFINGSDVTLNRPSFERFAQNAVTFTTISRTRTLDGTIIGLGEYNATTNPRGIVNGLMDPGIMPSMGLVDLRTENGNYSFAMVMDPGPLNPDHWIGRMAFIENGMAIIGGNDVIRLSITDNNFSKASGQHFVYLAGCRQLTYALNRHYDGYLDGMKDQLNSNATMDAEANLVLGNSFMGFRGTSWAINFSTVTGIKRHIATLVASNVIYKTGSSGITQRNTDRGMVHGNLIYDLRGYGAYTLDYSGFFASNYVRSVDLTGGYFGVKAGQHLFVTQFNVDDYVRTAVTSGTGGEPGGSTTVTTMYQRAGAVATGAGTVRMNGVWIGETSNKAMYGILNDTGTTLELDGTNRAPATLPVLSLGSIAEINADHVGPILRADNNIFAPLFNFADGVLRRGRGPGRMFNASALPTSGTWRPQDAIWNTAPGAVGQGWVCLTGGTLNAAPAALNMVTTSGSGLVDIDRMPTDIKAGDYITIPGAVTSAVVSRLETLYDPTDVQLATPTGYRMHLSATATASLSLSTISFVAPTFGILAPALRHLALSVVWDAPSLAAGASATQTITATGALVSDFVDLAITNGLPVGLTCRANVTTASTITLTMTNISAAVIDPPSRTFTARVSA
ncbi:hypothetical protein [Deinococcus alpinitundrae]|uniref:hypothetical protein n=1 Tax=Deinococcus alpinitundrae TaxID=468913 RepID=UPI0013799164|nr:hypothetical protein [Deinococcus alpinitundrae]